MARPRSAQEFIHWLEVGAGARWIRLAAALLGIVLLSVRVTWTQFHGVTSETALVQADVGRQLASGHGFTTLVNYPQTAAFLQAKGVRFDPGQAYPELHQAPLYSILIAAGLRVMPATFRDGLFAAPPVPPDGFRADYFLLTLNVVLIWITAWLTFDLGRRLFDARVAWVSMLALLLSVGVWQQTVVVNGTPLLMVLALLAFWIWTRLEESLEADDAGLSRALRWGALLGVTCGLLFLTEYSAGALVVVALGYAVLRLAGRSRALLVLVMVAGFVTTTGPWIVRNLSVAGHPVALAAQNVALKYGDPTAEPAAQRNTLSATLPTVDLNKLGNKTLTSLQESLKARLWSGGAMWFTAFFVASCLYAFRSRRVNALRLVFTLGLAVLLISQAAFNSGESERHVAIWLAPLLIIFGAGFFFVLLSSNAVLSQWPRACAGLLLLAQALPLLHDALEPRRLHFQYPPYFPGLFMGMRDELTRRDHHGRFGIMADVPAGVAWYARQRVWSQPVKLRDFYALTLEQPIGELLLTPKTLDRPFFSELAARPVEPNAIGRAANLFGDWGRIYAGLFTGAFPSEFPLNAPQKLAENLYVMLNPALPPVTGK